MDIMVRPISSSSFLGDDDNGGDASRRLGGTIAGARDGCCGRQPAVRRWDAAVGRRRKQGGGKGASAEPLVAVGAGRRHVWGGPRLRALAVHVHVHVAVCVSSPSCSWAPLLHVGLLVLAVACAHTAFFAGPPSFTGSCASRCLDN
jgi:hypothetical protein